MKNSLLTAYNITKLQYHYNFRLGLIRYTSEYNFFNVAGYLAEVEENLIKHDTPLLRNILFECLSIADQINNLSRDTASNTIDADMYCTFVNDVDKLFTDALIYTAGSNGRIFADLNILLHDGPIASDIRGDKEFIINAWALDIEKNNTLVSRARMNGVQKIEFCEIIDRVRWVIAELSQIFPDEDLTKQTTNIAQTANHYTRTASLEEIRVLYDALIWHKFLSKETALSHFQYVINGAHIPVNMTPFLPLNWLGTAANLAYFIDTLFGDTDKNRVWEIATRCFTIGGKVPNKKTLTDTISKINQGIKNKPRGSADIDNIIRSMA